MTNEFLIELAHTRGLVFDPERAEAIRPALESLLDRLQLLADALPEGSDPLAFRPGP